MDVDANLCCPDALSAVLSCLCFPAWLRSLRVFDQNERAAVLVWGKYVGSINEPGIHIVNPCGVVTRKISIARQTLDIREVGVTDKDGNPIYISGNVAYKIISAKKATVDTASPEKYTNEMAPMALRTVAAKSHYNDLRGESTSQMLAEELQKLVTSAGVRIQRFQLTDLTYDKQIASAMLARQQATAQVDAKRTLVHGAAETASSTVMRLKQLGHTFTSENEQRLIHDLLLKNLDPDFKSRLLTGKDSCAPDASSAACTACRAECSAACECSAYCEPLIKDAALCVEQGGRWEESLSQSFDNVLKAMLTLFEISTTEGWADVMYAACDSIDQYIQPMRDHQQWVFAPFFVVYMIFSNMFIINLSVGVIVDKFMDLKQSGKDDILLTPAQQKWLESQKLLLSSTRFFDITDLDRMPPFRRKVYRVISSIYFSGFIMLAIALHSASMGMTMFPQGESWDDVRFVTKRVFSAIFLVEMLMKLFALRGSYWEDRWNKFDFFCVVVKFLAAEALRGVGGIVLDANGDRFCNELGRRDYVTGEMWKNKPPFHLCLNKAAADEIIWHAKHYTGRGVMKFYASGEDLAKDMGVPLQRIVDAHQKHFEAAKKQEKDPEADCIANCYCLLKCFNPDPDGGPFPAYPSGKTWDEPSGKTGSGKKFFHNIIDGSKVPTEPFYVAIITPVIHYCMGGLECTVDAECIDKKSGKVIPGLYVAGEAAGGIHGNNRLGGNSLLDCVVFGRVAGKAACKFTFGAGEKFKPCPPPGELKDLCK
eukprot:s8_g37.t1